jgi:hypothetical protein
LHKSPKFEILTFYPPHKIVYRRLQKLYLRLLIAPIFSFKNIPELLDIIAGRDSSFGTANRYGLDGPGIESQWGPDYPHLSRLALWSTQPPIPGHFPGGKRPGVVFTHLM